MFNIKNLFKKETKSNDFIPIWDNGFVLEKRITRTDYLYLYKGWAYSCVNIIANNTATLSWHLLNNKNNSESVMTHKYMELIDYKLINEIVWYLELTWSAYILKERFWNKVDKLTVLRSDKVTLQDNVTPDKPYRYQDWKGIMRDYTNDDIIEITLYNPLSNPPLKSKGVSPMAAIALQAEMDQETVLNNNRLLKNGAIPRWALTTDKSLTGDEVERYETGWNNKYQGWKNAGKMAVLWSWLKLSTVWFSPKELDFVEGRRFTRDEVYAIFWVPKEIAWLLENSNLASAKVAESIFYRNTIQPIAKLIQDAFNKQLFNGIWYFEFTNIIPTDWEEIRKNLEAWIYTINEARAMLNLWNINEWDKLKISDMLLSDVTQQEQEKQITKIKELEWFWNKVKAYMPWTEEYIAKKWQEKTAREDEYEEKLKKKLIQVFNQQEKDILKQFDTKKLTDPEFWSYLALYLALTTEVFNEVVQEEWNRALELVWVSSLFRVWETSLNKWIEQNVLKFAKEVDRTTRDKVIKAINEWNEAWLWAGAITEKVKWVYSELKTSRAQKIVRTEIIRASSKANIEAWVQSEVVKNKQWWTWLDERVCEHCWPMHGTEVPLKTNFFEKWQVAPWDYLVNYESVDGAPLHPQCRCFMIPKTD